MIKDLLFVIDNVEQAKPVLESAVSMAEHHDAHCEIVVLTPGPLLAAELAPLGAMYVPDETMRRDEEKRLTLVRKMVEGAKCPIEVAGLSDDVAWIPHDLRLSRPLVDLCVVGTQECWEVPWLRQRVFDTILLATGTPLLLLPPGKRLGGIRRATIGWKASPETNRAIHDIIAIAEPEAELELVSVGADPDDGHASSTLAAAERHLVRHGFRVTVTELAEGDWSSIAEVLEHHMIRREADLLVVGAYVHSRLMEAAFGGVTHDLLRRARVPTLLSH